MAMICINTRIQAPREIVFDLSRNIDLHLESTAHTNEVVIAGRQSGLIELNETVTWRAKHLGCYRELTTKITAMEYPVKFEDRMTKGPFKYLQHIHLFREEDSGTLMTDLFYFAAPYGFLGRIVTVLGLKPYMKRLLYKRNCMIKARAEAFLTNP
ncbi:SRPBCC family protein [Edaphocola aurantiacus]|uniref:SRPBCC family protein n=1 Tax=Edaphocola aurantiacus TaxID=2601682 RepID=UPI001C944F0C|nr:SRPBCC family protein [Edaphocola aurantiacus]